MTRPKRSIPMGLPGLTLVLATLVLSTSADTDEPVGGGDGPFVADSARAWDQRLARDRDRRLVPVQAQGDIRFTLDASSFRTGPESRRVELYVRIPRVALAWVRVGQEYKAELRIKVELDDSRGSRKRQGEVERAVTSPTFEDTRRVDAHVVQVLTLDTNFDPAEVTVEVQDLRAKKKTFIGLIKGSLVSGKARGYLPQSWGPDPDRQLSRLTFGTATSSADAATGGEASVHGGMAITPNPTRFFGREFEVFPVYYEVYGLGPDGHFLTDSLTHRLRYRVIAADSTELLNTEVVGAAPSGQWGRLQRFSVEGYPTGTYILAVELLDGQGGVADATYGQFHVAWSETAWMQDEKTVLDDARILLPGIEFEEFQEMPPGERAAYMAQVWADLNPAPLEDTNPAEVEFRRRVRRAESRYGGLEGGKLSDRGRVYIRWGEPDEVIVVRMPTRTETLETVMAEELMGSLGSTIDFTDPRYIEFLRRYALDNPAFEIWSYFGGGDPIIPSQRGPNRGMAFIFVDDVGTGLYHLGYTNVFGIM